MGKSNFIYCLPKKTNIIDIERQKNCQKNIFNSNGLFHKKSIPPCSGHRNSRGIKYCKIPGGGESLDRIRLAQFLKMDILNKGGGYGIFLESLIKRKVFPKVYQMTSYISKNLHRYYHNQSFHHTKPVEKEQNEIIKSLITHVN